MYKEYIDRWLADPNRDDSLTLNTLGNIDKILDYVKELFPNILSIDSNGWQGDYWYGLSNGKEQVTLFVSAFYGRYELSNKEEIDV